jgi:Tol biopolymer transport system component
MPSGSAIDPRWSPVGGQIAFVHVSEETADAAQSAGEARTIYVVDVGTARLTRLSR